MANTPNIFTDPKTAELAPIIEMKEVITDAPATGQYAAVTEYLASKPGWKKSFFKWRKEHKLPYASKNALVWEIINMTQPEEDGAW